MIKAKLGIVGLATMGQNLALNVARHGIPVAVYNRTADRTAALMARVQGEPVFPASTLRDLVEATEPPRAILLMVQAGKPVDEVLDELFALLRPGDLVADGGNSHVEDTERRAKVAKARGLLYLGVGISGGEAGALHGPSIMVGGHEQGYRRVEAVFKAMAAQGPEGPCCGYFGPGSAGHYVKMVHNGVEYAIMQAIAESYDLLKRGLGRGPDHISSIFAQWNKKLGSYLLEISVDILRFRDGDTGQPLVELVKDTAEQKGTGKWSTQAALDLGAPTPSLAAAVFARIVSALRDERLQAEVVLPGPTPGLSVDPAQFIQDLEKAFGLALVVAYAQGFRQLQQAAAHRGWRLSLAEVARVWLAGCIIRTKLLRTMGDVFLREPGLPFLLLAEPFRAMWAEDQGALRRVVAWACTHGIPVPVLSSSLELVDAYRTGRLPANLIQAQRDCFGAHTYERLDRPGKFHTPWRTE